MLKMPPLVSICIPNYNKASYIGETIDSVYAQTYSNIELIIIDDCSTDNSVDVIMDRIKSAPFNTIFLKNDKNRGVCFSLNRAIEIAAGKYYQMIGSDDLIMKHKIASQVQTLEKLPEEYAIVFGKSYRIDTSGNYLEIDYYESIGFDPSILGQAGFEDLLLQNFIPSAAHLVRVSAIKEVGTYDESLRVEDWDLWLRLTRKFKFFFMDDYNSLYRIVPFSLSNHPQNFTDIYTTYCKTLLKHIHYSAKGDRNIARNVKALSLTVYKYNGIQAKELLKINFHLNPTIKSLILLLSARLGIKYSFYEALKPARQ